MDAAHLVYGVFLSAIWCFSKIYLPAPAGRQRLSVLGALNAVTKEIVYVPEDKYVSAETVCVMLRKLSTDGKSPVTVFLDNAKYQKCKVVTDLANELGIELEHLPSYSPNLNLIERFWKHLRENVLDSEIFSDYADFKSSILNFLNVGHRKHKRELDTLLSWNFQVFKKRNNDP